MTWSPCTRPIFFDEFVAAALDRGFGLELAQPVPVAADEGVGREVGGIVDQDHVDAVGLRLLQQLGVGVEVGRMHDQHVRLGIRRDRLGDRLGAGLDAPVRVAGLEHAAPAFDFALEICGPALRQVEAHRHRHQHDALALERRA